MSLSVHRLRLTQSNLINLQYDLNIVPLLTKEDFKSHYELLGRFDMNLNCDFSDSSDFNSIELYNKLKQYNIYLKIGDIISYDMNTYYYDHPLIKFDIF